MRKTYGLSLTLSIIFLLLMVSPRRVHAQWPPFVFSLTPSHTEGKITYEIEYYSRVDWAMRDITIKIPLPEGTRFWEANAPPTTEADFDGKEITFLTPDLTHRAIRRTFFTVEVTDPERTDFTTQAWIAWEGDNPGDFLTGEVSIDITRRSLDWEEPAESRLQLEANATVTDNTIIYAIYPKNIGESQYIRMQDLRVKLPIPDGATYVSAEAPPFFTVDFDGREVTFSTVEVERQAEIPPLIVEVSTVGVTDATLTTFAWATWKNAGFLVGKSVVAQEEARTGDIVVQPGTWQQVTADLIGDVPLSNYDLTSLALQEDGPNLKVIFHLVGALDSVDAPVENLLFIDSDCRIETGKWERLRGVEYLVWYRHSADQAELLFLDEQQKEWDFTRRIKLNHLARGTMVEIWIPYDLLEQNRQFCWLAETVNQIAILDSEPLSDYIPNREISILTNYEGRTVTDPITESQVLNQPSTGVIIDAGDTWRYLPVWAEPLDDWPTLGFDDTDWLSGPTSIGYGTKQYGTDLRNVTRPIQSDGKPLLVQQTHEEVGVTLAVLPSGDVNAVLLRHTFNITDPTSLTQLTLEMEYEGGFVAYLNGVEVARRNLGEPNTPVIYDTLATETDLESSTLETIDLSNHLPNLVSGNNILAVQAHKSVNGSSLSVTPKLTWSINPWDIGSSVNLTSIDNDDAETAPTSSSIPEITGKLAVPIDNGQVGYDVHLFSLPNGEEIARIPDARQPNFRFDGQRMLINREGGGIENVYEYNFIDGTERQVSDAPQDWHPFYDPWGNRVVYGNSELTVGQPLPKYDESDEPVIDEKTGEIATYGPRQPFIFVQCGLLPPHEETEPRCRDIPNLGVLVPAGQAGEIQGTHPVWTSNDLIAYKGCNTWVGSALCGIYSVPSSSTKGFSNGFIPRQLTQDSSDAPTDTKGELIAFMSQQDGDWEAYVMDLNGGNVKNLSQSPDSNDGLPTISPDGHWVAFVSDRDGQWAIWAVPVAGGSTQKLFDLPVNNPWGDGKRAWINERISWGP